MKAPVAPRHGARALKADLVRADKLRDVAVCNNFLGRATMAFRRQDSPYQPTAQGLGQALLDELRRMKEEANRG